MGMWDWVADMAPTLIETGVKAYGANQKAKSYNQATDTAVAAQNAATEREIAAREQANILLRQQQQMASPGLTALQSVIGRADQLTPAQVQAIDDARRTTLDSLKGSALRGSARATSATVADTTNRVTNQMLSQNQTRADNAAGSLAGQYFSAGNSVANNTANTGRVASEGLTGVGQLQSNNAINQGTINGTAIGDIGAVIADTVKASQNQKRDSSYKDITVLKNGDSITWDDRV